MFNKFKYHKSFAPKIWETRTKINPMVAQSLKMMASEFVRYLGSVAKLPISIADIQDVLVHGSITNYYWDKHSDIDICIVADLTRIRNFLSQANENIVLQSLKHSWKSTFFISVFGRGIDISLVDKSDDLAPKYKKVGPSYSLKYDKWIVAPSRLSDTELRSLYRASRIRYRAMMRQCRYMLRHKMSSEYIDAFLADMQGIRIRSMNLQYEQPITSTTMAFKMVRNTGTFRKLRKMSKGQRSKKFRLE